YKHLAKPKHRCSERKQFALFSGELTSINQIVVSQKWNNKKYSLMRSHFLEVLNNEKAVTKG
ncbi:MAG: hypothetical protein N2044_13200, partial [Cyclobacteriaceae bacterium]|nr:hypothetical protein [Cyclobacteriaceae bacterium]